MPQLDPDTLDTALLAAYFAILGALALMGAQRWLMVILHARHRRARPTPAEPLPDCLSELPHVLVQLPVYNEPRVVRRVIEATAALDWPRDRLTIQVLDDSLDATTALARDAVLALLAGGVDARLVRRIDRAGFKAGALAHGLGRAPGDLVAIFDADFVPPPSFLRETVPYFADPAIGLVQTRWEHMNRRDSLLTELQGIALDAHLAIEQVARNRSGRFFNFNGTGGVWRRAAIEDAGGWSADTLTEDLDLSFRAQLRGWRFVYLDDVVSPAELPADIRAFRSQQRRWARGGAETARKLMGAVLRARIPLPVKAEAALQLVMHAAYPLAIALLLLMPFVMRVRFEESRLAWLVVDLPFSLAAATSAFGFYAASQRALFPREWPARLRFVPLVVGLGIGMAVVNARAWLRGLVPRSAPAEFVRTPKRGLDLGTFAPPEAADAGAALDPALRLPALEVLLELSLAAYTAWTIAVALSQGRYVAAPFLGLFLFGFLYVSLLSLSHARAARATMRVPWSPPTSTSASSAPARRTAPAPSASAAAGETGTPRAETAGTIAASA